MAVLASAGNEAGARTSRAVAASGRSRSAKALVSKMGRVWGVKMFVGGDDRAARHGVSVALASSRSWFQAHNAVLDRGGAGMPLDIVEC